jgi:glutamyl-tRNA reductase
MSLLVVGLSHRSAPVDLLERVALDHDGVTKLATDATTGPHVGEALVLATCNRVEVYADVNKFHGAVAELTALLAQHTSVSHEALTEHLYVHYEERAVAHLFSVAAGLESMVVGEGQILGQVRTALRVAQEAGTTGPLLNEAFQQALRVGKRAHTETDIDRAGQSLVTVGTGLAERALGGLAGRRALVVGAGSMSSLVATTLAARADDAALAELVIVNRTLDHAVRLADRLTARARAFEALPDALAAADLIVSCTGALGTVISADLVATARARRGDAAQAFVDLALPHDVDPTVGDLDGVTLVDLAGLGEVLEHEDRAVDAEAVRGIVDEEVAGFLGWLRATSVAPTVVALRSMAARVVDAELVRLAGRLPDLDQATRDELAQTVRRVVDKLLHSPTVRVKELAGEPDGASYAAALRELFDLDPTRVDAVTRHAAAEDPS